MVTAVQIISRVNLSVIVQIILDITEGLKLLAANFHLHIYQVTAAKETIGRNSNSTAENRRNRSIKESYIL